MKYLDFFQQRIPTPLPSPNGQGEVNVPCPLHGDQDGKGNQLGINLETGRWRCRSSQCRGSKGGSWRRFEQILTGEIGGDSELPAQPIDPALVEAHHTILLGHRKTIDLLQKKRGYTLETIQRFKLGWDSERIWIPIQDATGQFVNVRKYQPGAARDKMIAYGPGYNRARLFPETSLESDWVLLLEGETDTLLGCQLGYPAVTGTGGADTWLEEFSRRLEGKDVVVCYDCDETGRKGARQAAVKLLGRARRVRVLTLPLAGTKEEKDFTNYFVDLGHTREDFDALIERAEEVETKISHTTGPADEVEQIHLSAIGEDRLVGKRVGATVLVAGKDLAPFQVPFRIAYQCEMGEKICGGCGIARAGGQTEVKIPEWSPDLLAMTNVPEPVLEAILAGLADVPGKCRKFRHQVLEHANLEAIKAIPEIDFEASESGYVIRSLYFLGHGMETNHTYGVEAVVMPDPKNQYATALVYSAIPSRDSVEKFELAPGDLELLSMFRVSEAR